MLADPSSFRGSAESSPTIIGYLEQTAELESILRTCPTSSTPTAGVTDDPTGPKAADIVSAIAPRGGWDRGRDCRHAVVLGLRECGSATRGELDGNGRIDTADRSNATRSERKPIRSERGARPWWC